jgi:predicted PurR-regulated permease PerM
MFFFLALALAVYAAYLVRDVLMLIYVSALSAIVLMPLIDLVREIRVGSWRPGRAAALAIVAVVLLGGLALVFALALPPFVRDLTGLLSQKPASFQALYQWVNELPFTNRLDLSSLQSYATSFLASALGLAKNLVNGTVAFAAWMVLTTYFILDGEAAFTWAMSLVRPDQRARLEPTLRRAEVRVRNWLIGQGLLMLALGLASFIAFGILRVKYFYSLSVLTGLANIVPVVGPLVTIILSSGVAAIDSTGKLIGVLIFYAVYMQFESAYLSPRVQQRTVNLPPLAVLIALLIGSALAGILGALISVPTAALLSVLIDEYLVYKDAA